MQDFLKLQDLTDAEIIGLVDFGINLKYMQKNNIPHAYLKGKTLGMIFSKASTRTRVSFEVGIRQLGGHAIFLSANDMQLGRGESVADTARALSRYIDLIMIRTGKHSDIEELADFASIPVINGLTSYCHPTQALADLMTIKEYKGKLEGIKLCYIGDGNNVANSLIVGGIKAGMTVNVACPKGYEPDADIVKWALESGRFEIGEEIAYLAKNADVIYTDVWVSMGDEKETEIRKKVFKDYQVNDKILSYAKDDAIVQHCLPAHKGEEITSEVFEAHSAEIFEEAENRLHMHKAIMATVMGVRGV
ncbi:MAG: ornithine carbamoyltransferase [Clostridia bacterium]